jgi:phage/conjugal plasmid C-4 type zinc finger TraR family protein
MDRFADVIDLAQAHIEREMELRIERIRRSTQTGGGTAYCVDCGGEIPPRRRDRVPNAHRCVPCQASLEGKWPAR